MKFRYILGTLVPCLALSPIASALVMDFNNGSGSYVSNGITGTASATGGSLRYSSTEDGIGVGGLIGALGQGETLKLAFNQTIKVNNVYFTQWENPGLFITYDQVRFDYEPGAYLTFTDSGQGVTLLDKFATGGINLDSFTLLPQNGLTQVWLHHIDFDLVPTTPTEPTQPTNPTEPTNPTQPTIPTDTTPAGVPAPGTLLLLGGGMLGLGATRRKRRDA